MYNHIKVVTSNFMSMDFIYYPLISPQSSWGEEYPGLLMMTSPHTAARHRKGDVLAAFLQVNGDHQLRADEFENIITETTRMFFETQGSLTKAIQTAFDWANRLLYDRNSERGDAAAFVEGSLNFLVFHEGSFYIGQYGTATTIHISPEKYETFGSSITTNEGLGQVRRIQARFYRCDAGLNDLIILSADVPHTWSANTLSESTSFNTQTLRTRLLNQVSKPLEALVIRCVAGNGKVVRGSWKESSDEVETSSTSSAYQRVNDIEYSADDIVSARDVHPEEAEYEDQDGRLGHEEGGENTDEAGMILSEDGTFHEPADADDLSRRAQQEDIPIQIGTTEGSTNPQKSILKKNESNSLMLFLARLWMNAKMQIAKIRLGFSRFTSRFPKKQSPISPSGPSIFSILMILLLPAVLVLSAISVYIRTGKTEQFNSYFSQAQEVFELAEKSKDDQEKHDYWSQTLQLVLRAEEFNVTRESRLLYEQAQFLMDEMDLAARLDFRPALTTFFPDGVVITRIKSSYSGVYLLDATSGSILRVYLNSKGFYEIDDTFTCTPGTYGLETVTKLIDFVTLPANDENYKVMGIDAKGNLLYCRTNDRTDSRTLSAPEGGWGRISALGYDQDILYVMDAEKNAIWMYAGKNPSKPDVATAAGIVFADSPKKFFDNDIPDLKGAIDLAINQQELLILHADGHMSLCRYGTQKEVRLTECQDPASYTDNRIGRDNKKPWIFLDARFILMQDTKLPNLAIFILEADEPAVYQFSFQLNLERTLRIMPNKNYPVPDKSPSGFGITPDMEIFLAFDNRLYIAPMR